MSTTRVIAAVWGENGLFAECRQSSHTLQTRQTSTVDRRRPSSWDRCYDFKNIFAEKCCQKYWRFLAQTTASFCKIVIITMFFLRKTPIFRRKLAKIAENCDHNIGPWKFRSRSYDLELQQGVFRYFSPTLKTTYLAYYYNPGVVGSCKFKSRRIVSWIQSYDLELQRQRCRHLPGE
jgi:hypothetical protein